MDEVNGGVYRWKWPFRRRAMMLREKHCTHSYFCHTCTCVFPSLNNLYLPGKYFSLSWVFVHQQRKASAFCCEVKQCSMFVFIHPRVTHTATLPTDQ